MNNSQDPVINSFRQFGDIKTFPTQSYSSEVNGLDPTVVNMARAIKSVETQGQSDPYKASGKSGEYGAYQYTPETWKGDSQKYLGQEVPLQGATIEQQNKVAYGKIKDLKTQGYNPQQVASIWNSGKPDPTGNVGTNSKGVKYDTPQYVKSVVNSYQQFKNGQYPTPQPTASTVGNTTQNNDSVQEPSLGSELSGRLSDAGTALSKASQGEINPISGILQAGGAAAGAVGDVVNKGAELIPGVKQVEGLIGKGVGKLAQTGLGQSVLGGWNSFAQAHPEAADDIGAIGNIATAIPIFKGFSIAKEAIGSSIAKAIGKDALSGVISDVSEKETASTLAKGIAQRGTTKSLLTGTISPVADSGTKDLAQTVVDNVPGFTKAKDLSSKINLTQDTVSAMADDLKKQVINSGKDKIYSFKELKSSLDDIPKPLGIVKDQEAILERVKNAALEIARKNGGKISSLFDARKEFDSVIKQQLPNLYSSDTLTPIRLAVRDIRRGMNNFIAKNLPDVSFKDSLQLQSKLLEAVENMSGKVASGSDKEIGTSRIGRFAKRHPVVSGLIKKGAKYAGTATAAGLGIEGAHKLLGE